MVCTVLGYTRLTGVSKKGRDYDFYSVAIAYDAEPGYKGRRVNTLSLDPCYGAQIDDLMPPFDAVVDTNFSGKVIGFSV